MLKWLVFKMTLTALCSTDVFSIPVLLVMFHILRSIELV